MSNFGVNVYGNLNPSTGKKLTFEDFDKNGDGVISKDELKDTLEENDLENVKMKDIDKNGDKKLSEEEFAVWEQKTKMQEMVNNLESQVRKDFCGAKSKYVELVVSALRDYIDGFALSYVGDVENMASEFEKALPEQYTKIKDNLLKNDPTEIRSNVLDDIYNQLLEDEDLEITKENGKQLFKLMDKAALDFVNNYTGNDLRTDLTNYMIEYLDKSCSEVLEKDIQEYRETFKSFGAGVDSSELEGLKEFAKDLLMAAINKGVPVKLGDTYLTNAKAIDKALAEYEDAYELNDAIEDFIASITDASPLQVLYGEEAVAGLTPIEKENDEVPVDDDEVPGDDDEVPGDGGEVTGEGGEVPGEGDEVPGDVDTGDVHRAPERDPYAQYKINTNNIDYSQIRGYFEEREITTYNYNYEGNNIQIKNRCADYLNSNYQLKGQLSREVHDTLQQYGLNDGQIQNIFRNIYSMSVQDTVDNMEIESRVDKYRLQTYVVNIQDLVDTFLETFNNNLGKEVADMLESDTDMDLQDLYLESIKMPSNMTTMRSINKDTLRRSAEGRLQRFHGQLETKSKTLCTANGVEYNPIYFNTCFNNAKGIAIRDSIVEEDNPIKGYPKVATINYQKCTQLFLETFKKLYTDWVETEKAKKAEKETNDGTSEEKPEETEE